MIRHRVRDGRRDPHDERRDLWRSFLEVVRLRGRAAVLMENVPDMALDKEMFILRTMVQELESTRLRRRGAGRRHLAVRRAAVPAAADPGGACATAPRSTGRQQAPERVTVWNAIGDLPEVEGGWRPEGGAEGWADYDGAGDGVSSGGCGTACRTADRAQGVRPHHPPGPRG